MPFREELSFVLFIAVISEILNPNKTYSLEGNILSLLSETGFKNCRIDKNNNQLSLYYENTVYRNEKNAIEEITKILSIYLSKNDTITCYHLNNQVPIFSYQIHYCKTREKIKYKNLKFNSKNHINLKNEFPSSKHSIDFTLRPHGKVFFNEEDGIRPQVNLITGFQSLLWKGGTIKISAIIQIYNKIKSLTGYDFIWKPYYININQLLHIKNNQFISISAGQFWEDRYGLDIEWKQFLFSSSFSYGINWGITGYSFFDYPTWRYTNIIEKNRISYFVDCDYYIKKYNLTAALLIGQFLYGDQGWRIEINRFFNETQIGFFYMNIQGEKNAGFCFTIPLSPPKIPPLKKIRFRLNKHLSGEYRVMRKTFYGDRYETGHSLKKWLPYYRPLYINQKQSHTNQ